MNPVQPADSLLVQLQELLDSGRLPTGAAKSGTRLLRRVNSPVRIAVLGLPGSGKSELINFLAGCRIIPENAKLPTLELQFDATSRTTITKQDGSTDTFDGLAFDQVLQTHTAFIKVETDLPVLKRTSLLEVVTDGNPDDQVAAIGWATRRADILLWCSQGFSAAEQKLWARVPDALKDRSFFVLNMADKLSAQGILSDRITALQNIVANEFHSLFPIATLQALTAVDPQGTPDQSLLIASGGKALKKAISRQVDLGRRADIDSVLMFLKRYDATSVTEAPSKIISHPATSKPQGQSAESTIKKPDAEPTAPIQVTSNPQDPNTAALIYLNDRAVSMAQAAPHLEPTDILDQCCETANHLADLFADNESDDSAVPEDVLDAAEVLVLMQLEDGEGPAADAVTLLLQLKRGFGDRIAA